MSVVKNVERYSTDDFFKLFLAALVLRNRSFIWMRTAQAIRERGRMNALYMWLEYQVEKQKGSGSEAYRRFLDRLRNAMKPSETGSFNRFRHVLSAMRMSATSIGGPGFEYYKIEISCVTARSYLETAAPAMRKLAEDAAKVYAEYRVTN